MKHPIKFSDDGNRSVCIPGCYFCEVLPEGGPVVKKEELSSVDAALEKYNQSNSTSFSIVAPEEADRTGINSPSDEHYSLQYNYTMPAVKISGSDLEKATSSVPEIKGLKEAHICSLCKPITQEGWGVLVDGLLEKFGAQYGLSKESFVFPEGFEGKMCSFYAGRTKECKRHACSYSAKFLPRAIRESNGKVLTELMNEPDLMKRFDIVDKYIK